MSNYAARAALAAVAVVFLGGTADAGIVIGSSIGGALYPLGGSGSPNLFKSGAAVVSPFSVEFNTTGSSNGGVAGVLATADFTADTLTLSIQSGPGLYSLDTFHYEFDFDSIQVDSGGHVYGLTDLGGNLPVASATTTASTIKVVLGYPLSGAVRTRTYGIVTVPEPGPLALAGLAAGACLMARRRRA